MAGVRPATHLDGPYRNEQLIGSNLEGYQGGPINVLIVEEIDCNRKLLRLILQAEGPHVIEAGDGAEALAILERRPVDGIISDILMPTMDGYRPCYEVRTSNRFESLPFIFYSSAFASPSDENWRWSWARIASSTSRLRPKHCLRRSRKSPYSHGRKNDASLLLHKNWN